MSDIVRIFLLVCCMFLSFRLGMLYDRQVCMKQAMKELEEASVKFNETLIKLASDNETNDERSI